MTFTNVLSAATAGLTVAQQRAQVVADNIANATTPGYARRTVEVSARAATFNVEVIDITRATGGRLTTERLAVSADSTFANEKAEATATLSRAVGEPGSETGLFGAFVRFEQSLRDAAATPESDIYVEAVADSARRITREFNSLAQTSLDLRSAADAEIGVSVEELNVALSRIADINALGAGDVTPQVLDEQQRLIDQVNELVPVRVVRRDSVVDLFTETGVQLVGLEARQVSFNPTGAIAPGDALGTPLSGLTVDGIDVTPTGPGKQALQGGKIAGLFAVRDEVIPAFERELDAAATDLISRFADDAVDPTKPVGETGLFTTATTAPPGPGTSGVAYRIRLGAPYDPAAGGDPLLLRVGQGGTPGPDTGNGAQLNRFLDAMTNTTPPSGGVGSASSRVADVISRVAAADSSAADEAAYAGARLAAAEKAELSAVAVDTDVELQELLLLEQAYAANAQVIRVAGNLLDELRNLI